MELKFATVEQLKPTVKLRSGEDNALTELAASIKNRGIICPLIVTADGRQSYKVLDGRRRLRALKLSGAGPKVKIPVLLIKAKEGEDLETALISNAVRSELDTWDLAEAINLLAKTYQRTAQQIASALGKSDRYTNQLLSLFSLPKPILDALRQRRLTPSHGLSLLKLKDLPELRTRAFKQALDDNLSVRDLEVLVGALLDGADGVIDGAPLFQPSVYNTDSGSRLRFEPRRSSIRIEINLKTIEDLEAIISELQTRVKELSVKTTPGRLPGLVRVG